MPPPIPVIFDTDIGTDIDDLWALALLLAHPGLDLRAVTVMSNDISARARLAAKALRLAGRAAVPVGRAGREPLAFRDRPDEWKPNNETTHCDLIESADPEAGAEYPDAVELILKTLDESPEPIGIVGTGLWTNIALVLEKATPAQKSRIRFLSLMGAEVDIIHRENNVVLDPEAADLVLRAGLPAFIGTWSVTRTLFYPEAEAEEKIGRMKPGAWPEFFLAATRRWRERTGTYKPGPVLYDVVPVFFAAGRTPLIHSFQVKELSVELKGEHTRGLTVLGRGARPAYLAAAKEAGEHHFGDDPARPLLVSHAQDAAALKAEYDRLVFGL